jgi:hypothetical protein
MRVRAIDVFRGLSIVLMVFFSIICRLSDSLPGPLEHNVENSLHVGDFVLPMFLFASGMSLVFYARKRKKKKSGYMLDILERFGKLVGIAILLSPFSAGGWFEMDEVMLSALLFIPTIILLGFSEVFIFAAALFVFLLYLALQSMHLLPDFTAHYLGGYAAAVFYLPVMLGGVLAAKKIDEIEKLLVIAVLVSFILLVVVPPYKMEATPSFMALSVAFSLAVFAIVKNVNSGFLEYLGRKPFRYWVLMFVVLIVPIVFYAIFTGSSIPLGFGWGTVLAVTIASLFLLYLISVGMDFLASEFKEKYSQFTIK